jgi:RNA polymerase sigma factor (sigma-70 family)
MSEALIPPERRAESHREAAGALDASSNANQHKPMTTTSEPRTYEPSRPGENVTAATAVRQGFYRGPTPQFAGAYASREGAAKASAFRILIVGDNRDLTRGLPRRLRLRGHQVECAYTGAEALRAARAIQPEFVLIDASLPDLSGFEIAALLPAVIRSGNLRIVSVSGCGDDESRCLSQAAGCLSHLKIPVDFAEIETLLAGCGASIDSYFRMSGPSAGGRSGRPLHLPTAETTRRAVALSEVAPGVLVPSVLTRARGPLRLPGGNMPLPLGTSHFPTTRWTGVLRLLETDDSALREEALASLCRDYWYPLYAFARRLGRSPEDAEDLTQGFFAYVLEHDVFSLADRNMGTLRTFLLRVFQRYIGDMRDRETAQKRGGGREFVSLDLDGGEELYASDLATSDTPELLFDRSWARSLLRGALSALAASEQSAGREQQFERLQSFLSPDTVAEQDYDTAARESGLKPDAMRQAVSRLRKKFRECLREKVAATLHEPDEARIDAELGALRAALMGGG